LRLSGRPWILEEVWDFWGGLGLLRRLGILEEAWDS